MKTYEAELAAELLAEGAESPEATALAAMALRLGDDAATTMPLPETNLHRDHRATIFLLSSLGASFAVILLAVLSLPTVPGAALYPMKNFVAATATTLNPSLHTAVMMERSREVAVLAQRGAPQAQILDAVSAYDREFKLATNANYDDWEYCGRQLKEASSRTSGAAKAAIDKSLLNVYPKV